MLLFSILDKAKKQAQIPEPAIGSPKSYTDQKLIEKTSIDQIVSDGRYLYVLYGEHDGTVAMYTLSGVFQKAFVFYKHLNGVFRLATEEPYLYVMDKRENIYVFENGAFTCFLEKTLQRILQGSWILRAIPKITVCGKDRYGMLTKMQKNVSYIVSPIPCCIRIIWTRLLSIGLLRE